MTDQDRAIEEELNNPLNCPLFSKCHTVTSSYELLAQEVSQIKRAEEEAKKTREENHKHLEDKLDNYIQNDQKNSIKMSKAMEDLDTKVEQINNKSTTENKWFVRVGYIMMGVLAWLLLTAYGFNAMTTIIKDNQKDITTFTKEVREFMDKEIEKRHKMENNINRNYGAIQTLQQRKGQ